MKTYKLYLEIDSDIPTWDIVKHNLQELLFNSNMQVWRIRIEQK